MIHIQCDSAYELTMQAGAYEPDQSIHEYRSYLAWPASLASPLEFVTARLEQVPLLLALAPHATLWTGLGLYIAPDMTKSEAVLKHERHCAYMHVYTRHAEHLIDTHLRQPLVRLLTL